MATHSEFRAWHSKARAARNHNSSISIGKFCGYGIAECAKPEVVGLFHGYHLPFIGLDPLHWMAHNRRNAADYLARKRGKSTPHNPYPSRGEYDFQRWRACQPCAGMARLRMVESAIRFDGALRSVLSPWLLAA